MSLDQRWLVNQGDLSWASGALQGGHSSFLSNYGTFHANSEGGSMSWSLGGDLPGLVNHGTLTKDVGSGTTEVCFAVIEAEGTIMQRSGTLHFCKQWNTRLAGEDEHPGLPACTLTAYAEPPGELTRIDDETAQIVVGGQVQCEQPVDTTSLDFEVGGFVVEHVDPSLSPGSCDNQHCSGLALDDVDVLQLTRGCVLWAVISQTPGGDPSSDSYPGVACLPDSEQP